MTAAGSGAFGQRHFLTSDGRTTSSVTNRFAPFRRQPPARRFYVRVSTSLVARRKRRSRAIAARKNYFCAADFQVRELRDLFLSDSLSALSVLT